MVFSVKGYHTCSTKGGLTSIQSQIPFKSEPNDRQWLGQGYYFWTDSPYWAKKWYKKNYVVSEFDLNLQKEFVLDLVGNVLDQEYFCSIYDRVCNYLKNHLHRPLKKPPSFSKVIQFLIKQSQIPGKEGFFPYHAVRAKDKRYEQSIAFLDGKSACIPLVERHQICIYPKYKDTTIRFIRFTDSDDENILQQIHSMAPC